MTIKHILIAEDDSEMLIMMSDFLKTKGYMISTATTESQINSVLNAKRVDLILLDVMLGFENGIQICQNIRRDSSIPIILVSALSADYQKMDGYDVGADDYISKPFNPDLLLARLKAVLSRTGRTSSLVYRRKKEKYTFSSWQYDNKKNVAISPDGFQVALSKKETSLLRALLANPFIPLSREEIADAIDVVRKKNQKLDIAQSRAIDVLVGRLRSKIEKNPKEPELIRTERGIGYIFASDVEIENDVA